MELQNTTHTPPNISSSEETLFLLTRHTLAQLRTNTYNLYLNKNVVKLYICHILQLIPYCNSSNNFSYMKCVGTSHIYSQQIINSL